MMVPRFNPAADSRRGQKKRIRRTAGTAKNFGGLFLYRKRMSIGMAAYCHNPAVKRM